MSLSRRALLSAAALALPAPAFAAWPFGFGRRATPAPTDGRANYAGPPLRQQFGGWQFDQIRTAVSTRLQPVIRDGLEDRFFKDLAAATGIETATAALAESGGAVWTQTWTRTPGAPPPARFAWGGLVQSYTATAILQMVEAGDLALDATIDRWAPDLPNARWITVEDLLAETSGLPDADLVAAAALPPAFAPGAAWGASSANHALLLQIIATTDQTTWAESLARRIAMRRELGETDFVGAGPGGVSASALDVVRFWRDLLGDRLHGAETTQRRFYRLYPMGPGGEHHGLGVMASDLAAGPSASADTWLGYVSRSPGAPAMAAYSLATRATVAVALTGEGSPETLAQGLLGLLRPA
ncbi:serine hydrolase domain-containing protein [Phenylobacterium sp.]|uniref:serine hydrolase domain-containing protein n=1 Tax=Phenylobacterium sp. TaxID=1871053 RepID=UPI003002A8AC